MPRGFTLMELMMVCAILGVMASISVTEYTKFSARARRVEAVSALSSAADAMEAFFVESDTYARDFQELGFAIKGGFPLGPTQIVGKRYVYQLEADDNGWCMTATGNIDNDDFMDIVVIGTRC